MKNNFIYLFTGLLLLSSCETKIDTIAEYKDITVVYGLLNPNDTTHYIRITKAFSGEGNAYDLAGSGANFNYADGELNVTIDEYNTSNAFVKSYSLVKTVNEIPKDNGIFDETQNVLYKFSETNLNDDYTYKLKIVNNKLGKEITSETKITNDPVLANFNEMNKVKLANPDGSNLTHAFSIKPHQNSGRVKVNFIFNYTEHYTDTMIAPVDKKIKISLGEQNTTNIDGGEVLLYTLDGNSFFSAIQSGIPSSVPNLKSRRINNGTLEIVVAGPDLSTYIAVNEPSTSITQNKPEFTNLINGLGVFSSRNIKIVTTASLQSPFGFNADGQLNYHDDTLKRLLAMGLEFCNPRNYNASLPIQTPAPRCEDIVTNWASFNP